MKLNDIKNKRLLRQLKWGVAGCGRFTETTFLPGIQYNKRAKLISVYSSDITRAKNLTAKFSGKFAFDNYDKFLESDIEAVFIGSANFNHYEQVIKAAKAGKHILCEKPLAINAAQAEEMVNECQKNNVLLTVNYMHRFHPLAIKAKEIIDKGMLGKLVSISANFNINFTPDENFRFKKELSGGGALWDLGTHMIDLLRYFGGEIIDINGYIDNVVYKSEVEDTALGTVKFAKGGYGSFNVSCNTAKAFNRIDILGYNGALSIDKLVGRKTGYSRLVIDLKGETKKAFRNRSLKVNHVIKSVNRSFMYGAPLLVNGYDGLINIKLMEQLEAKCRNENS